MRSRWPESTRAQARELRKAPRSTTPRVRFDGTDWRIEVYDRGETRFKTPSWWRMLWLRFATREAAEQYLVLRGAP